MTGMEAKTAADRGEPAAFREYQEGATRRDPVVERWVGQIDRNDEDLFQALSEAFRAEDRSFASTDVYERLRRASSNRNASRAIREGDMFTLQNIMGQSSNRQDISGVRTISAFRDAVARPAYVCYMHGHMGDGKTDFACFVGEIWKDEMERREYDTVIGSNIKTLEEAETIETFPDFDEWLDEATEEERRLFIFDEASKHASGYASDAQDARDLLGKTINLIRKSYASIILIGHTGLDVHADIRRKTTNIIRKTSEKQAEIRERTDTGDGEGDIETVETIGGIPPTNWRYDTYEASDWSWEGEEDVATGLLAQLGEDVRAGMVDRDVAIYWASTWHDYDAKRIAEGSEWTPSVRRTQEIVREQEEEREVAVASE
jgi:hypothetical protein